ncbi:hypothetical protein A0J48_006965 [Sphaerospermopsis aphanizomenoides BCCUSP55]|uniref:KGK domain-containing protein n=1 Tax=Sphaerospermopsis aphanizomenoides TaxID=459663 RepID=UPI0019087EA3|nr:KGK domain-containing protein [Sphaerospermopsis aphanizomenoides]MBK1987277.1 hypothetical protein [Sphaerospermopsis aphanizomenoides BCCUSP55]
MEEFNLKHDDVVYFKEGIGPNSTQAYLADTLLRIMERWLQNDSRNNRFIIPFLTEGLECQVLRPGSTWNNGTLRFRFEFIPDEPEPEPEPESEELEATIESTPALPAASPLDDLRAELNIK